MDKEGRRIEDEEDVPIQSSMSPQDLLQQSGTQRCNCYRLVVLGSARVGKSSLVAR